MSTENNSQDNNRKGWMYSIGLHVFLVALALLPWFRFQYPPPGQDGILVSFGMPDRGQGDSRPKTQNVEKVPPQEAKQEVKEKVEKKKTEPVKKPVSKPKNDIPKKVVTTDKPDAPKVETSPEEIRRQKQQEEARQEQERIAEEQRKQQEAAEAKARQDAEYNKTKDQFGDLFGGTGKGKTGKAGNQGDPNGDPDAKNLEGISTGSGTIGGGLGGRGLVSKPTVKDNSQKTGKVVIRVCVGSNGDVVSADFTQKGSTTTDSQLIAIAKEASRKYKFTPSETDKQCGTITYDFVLR